MIRKESRRVNAFRGKERFLREMKEIKKNIAAASIAVVTVFAMALALIAAASVLYLPTVVSALDAEDAVPADVKQATPDGDANFGVNDWGDGNGAGLRSGGIMRDGTENSDVGGDGTGMGDMTSMEEYSGNVDQGSDGIIGNESDPAGDGTTARPGIMTTAPGAETTGESDGSTAGGIIGAIIAVAVVVAVIVLVIALMPKKTK